MICFFDNFLPHLGAVLEVDTFQRIDIVGPELALSYIRGRLLYLNMGRSLTGSGSGGKFADYPRDDELGCP